MLIDAKDRHYLVTLQAGRGLSHPRGHRRSTTTSSVSSRARSSRRAPSGRSWSLRPTLSDVVLKMPRGAQVIYPKDLGTILMQADIGPGHARARGGGRLGSALDDAVARGRVASSAYEIREDFAQHAQKNVHDLLGDDVDYDVHDS